MCNHFLEPSVSGHMESKAVKLEQTLSLYKFNRNKSKCIEIDK